jgi:hypothetical protein
MRRAAARAGRVAARCTQGVALVGSEDREGRRRRIESWVSGIPVPPGDGASWWLRWGRAPRGACDRPGLGRFGVQCDRFIVVEDLQRLTVEEFVAGLLGSYSDF